MQPRMPDRAPKTAIQIGSGLKKGGTWLAHHASKDTRHGTFVPQFAVPAEEPGPISPTATRRHEVPALAPGVCEAGCLVGTTAVLKTVPANRSFRRRRG